MRETLTGLLTGFIFGLGLCLSRMTDPSVVQGFLDIAGAWDPTLLFVMGGGVAAAFSYTGGDGGSLPGDVKAVGSGGTTSTGQLA